MPPERQAWCCLQVKLYDPCLSTLDVPWCEKVLYKYSSFPFLFLSQIRHGDLDEYFQHKNQACPPSLSQMGGLRPGTKSDLMPCLENPVPMKQDLSTSRVQVNILDGAGIIKMLRSGLAKTFQGYATDLHAVCHIPTSACRQTRHRPSLVSVHGRQLEGGHSQQERKGS